tara:strand:- start:2 stop:571 length:570 start_codon:yes stop_codon:yes gene_type:complete
MFVLKKNYFFIIESIKDIKLKNIKNFSKFNIIYRRKVPENFKKLKEFRLNCKKKRINFYLANDFKLMNKLNADGLYISAKNRKFYFWNNKSTNIKIIGSAHDIKEIYLKKQQGCTNIFLSRIFKTSYKKKQDFLGLIKFNLKIRASKEHITALGGIKINTFNKLKNVHCDSIALSSEIKKNNNVFRKFY